MTESPTIVDLSECLCDSPQFRAALEMNENDIDLLEGKLEKIVKLSATSVESGKTFISHQSNLLAALWDLGSYFSEDSYITAVFNKLTHCLEEIGKYQSMLIDQTSRIMYRNLNTFLKNDIRQVRDTKQHFYKISYELDNVIARHAQVPRNKAAESGELENLLTATRSCFRHMALDYVAAISLFQSNKRHELLSMMLSFAHANSTFFHQGSDLFQDTDPYLKKLGTEIEAIREENGELNKTLENRHLLVGKDTAIVQKGKSGELLAGYLFKRTSNAFKTWNRRWFILHNEQLVYMKRSGEVSLTTMEEDLRLCTVKPLTESDRRFCFEVLSPTKHHILQAESEDVYNTWISSLQNAIGNALSRTVEGSEDGRDHEKISDGGDQSKSSNNLGEADPARRKFSACGQIYKVPGNDVCCDCRASKPEWASINLGVTLCIECSGIHRSLGVHFSKVRSMVLDAWEPETLKVFAELGNVLVNRVYEANFETSGAQRPSAHSSRSEKEVWIRSKYVDKKYVQKSLLDPGFRETERLNSRRWSVRKLRRRPRSSDRRAKSRESRHAEVARVAPSRTPEEGTSPSEDTHPDRDIIIFGQDLQKQTLETGIQIDSDQDSTEGDSEDENAVTAEDISSLDPNNLLWKASYAHNLPIMCLALAMGADKNWGNPKQKGLTSLHQAVLSGSVMTCQYLILNGAKYNVQDDEGKTPLLWATSLGHVQQVCLLLKYRADQHICDNSGLAPLSAAVQNADADIVTLLRLATLDDEMRESEAGNPGDETFNAVVKDFSQRSPDNPVAKKRNINNN